MQDGIIKGVGNSRYLKSVPSFLSLYPTYEAFCEALISGTLPIDLNGINEAGWTQTGTALSKANLLKDTTAALYGLDKTATPDIVLQWLGKYNENWWSLLHGEAYSYYEEKQTKITERICITRVYYSSSSQKLQYSKTVTVDQLTGAVSLSNPSTLTISASNAGLTDAANALVSNAPCYILTIPLSSSDTAELCYIPEGATWSYGGQTTIGRDGQGNNAESGDLYLYDGAADSIKASTVSSQIVTVPAGETTYEHSTDRDAFPDSGTVDGITYNYLGVPFEKFPTMPRLETGHYTGTGTYGASNPNSLTFEFPLKAVFIYVPGTSGGNQANYDPSPFLMIPGVTKMVTYGYGGNSSTTVTVEWGTNSVAWYGATASIQLNDSAITYHYLALG